MPLLHHRWDATDVNAVAACGFVGHVKVAECGVPHQDERPQPRLPRADLYRAEQGPARSDCIGGSTWAPPSCSRDGARTPCE